MWQRDAVVVVVRALSYCHGRIPVVYRVLQEGGKASILSLQLNVRQSASDRFRSDHFRYSALNFLQNRLEIARSSL